jgi:hypothetical protein
MKSLSFIRCRRNIFTEPLSDNGRGIYRETNRLSFNKTRIAQKTTRPTIPLLSCVFFAARTCLPSRYLAMIRVIYIQTHRLMGGTNPCGGGVEYLHRDPASRKRRRKGSLKSETVKYDREYQGTRT